MSKWGGEASYNELVAILAQLKAGIPITGFASAGTGYVDIIDRALRQVGIVSISGGTGILVSGNLVDPRAIRALTTSDYIVVQVSGGTAVLVGGSAIDPRSIRTLTSSDVVSIQDFLSGLTSMPTTKQAKEVDFTWNVDGTVNTIVYKDTSGATAFTLTFAYSAGSAISITRT